MIIKYKSKKVEIPNVKVLSGVKNFSRGLMFRKRENARALLFKFNKPTSFSFTSLFVFFPFVIIWLDRDNNVLDVKKIKPFTWHIPSVKGYHKVLEIPINCFYDDKLSSLVGNQKVYKED